MAIPKFIQEKNQLFATELINNIKLKLDKLSTNDWLNVGFEAMDGKYNLLFSKLGINTSTTPSNKDIDTSKITNIDKVVNSLKSNMVKTFESMNGDELLTMLEQASNEKYDLLSAKLSGAVAQTTDDAIKIYTPTLIAGSIGVLALSGLIGYYFGRK